MRCCLVFCKKTNEEEKNSIFAYCIIMRLLTIINLINMKKVAWIVSIFILVVIAGLVFYKYYFVFGEGVKAGELNYMVKKGVIFKTYEGKLIQSGFRSTGKTAGSTIQSYEFEFSVENKGIADTLMLCSGKDMELHYKEYNGVLPWRGFSKYVVDKIIRIDNKAPGATPF